MSGLNIGVVGLGYFLFGFELHLLLFFILKVGRSKVAELAAVYLDNEVKADLFPAIADQISGKEQDQQVVDGMRDKEHISVDDGFAFEEVEFPKMMDQWYEYYHNENVLEELNFGLVDQMQLAHNAGYPQSQKGKALPYFKDQIGPVVYQFAVAVVQKHPQIGDVHR